MLSRVHGAGCPARRHSRLHSSRRARQRQATLNALRGLGLGLGLDPHPHPNPNPNPNQVGPHNDHFWHLFVQLKVDYLRFHRDLSASGALVETLTTLALTTLTLTLPVT